MEVTLIQATGLKDVNLFSKMDVYAVASISGAWIPDATQRTPVHKESGPNPRWNHTFKFSVPDPQSSQGQLSLTIRLLSDRSLGDKPIGQVHVPLKDLLAAPESRLSYAVVLKNGKSKGTLDLSVKVGDKFTAPAQPHPAPMAQSYPAQAYPGQSYPAPAPMGQSYPGQAGPSYPGRGGPGYAYPYPAPGQQPGYGYPMAAPHQQSGYGYQKPQKPKRGGGNMAMGLGAGLLGGLLIGDMVSDAASYDAGGFDDVGFDF